MIMSTVVIMRVQEHATMSTHSIAIGLQAGLIPLLMMSLLITRCLRLKPCHMVMMTLIVMICLMMTMRHSLILLQMRIILRKKSKRCRLQATSSQRLMLTSHTLVRTCQDTVMKRSQKCILILLYLRQIETLMFLHDPMRICRDTVMKRLQRCILILLYQHQQEISMLLYDPMRICQGIVTKRLQRCILITDLKFHLQWTFHLQQHLLMQLLWEQRQYHLWYLLIQYNSHRVSTLMHLLTVPQIRTEMWTTHQRWRRPLKQAQQLPVTKDQFVIRDQFVTKYQWLFQHLRTEEFLQERCLM